MNFMPDIARRDMQLADAATRAPFVVLMTPDKQWAPELGAAGPIGRSDETAFEAPLLADSPGSLGALPPPPAAPPDRKRGLFTTILSSAGHAILVFALVYAVGAAGKLDTPADTPIEVDIVEEPAQQALPQPAQMAEEAPIKEVQEPETRATQTETGVVAPPDTQPLAQPDDRSEPPTQAAQAPSDLPAELSPQELPQEQPQEQPELSPQETPALSPVAAPVMEAIATPPTEPAAEPESPTPLAQAEPPAALDFAASPRLSPQPSLPAPAPDSSQSSARERLRDQQQEAARARAQEMAQERARERQREQRAERERERRLAARERAQRQSAIAQRQQTQAAASRDAPPPAPAQASRPLGNDGYAQIVAARMRRFAPSSRSITGTSGTVVVRLSISPSGALASLGVTQSSGSATLDRAALATVRAAAPFPAPPNGGTRNFIQRITMR